MYSPLALRLSNAVLVCFVQGERGATSGFASPVFRARTFQRCSSSSHPGACAASPPPRSMPPRARLYGVAPTHPHLRTRSRNPHSLTYHHTPSPTPSPDPRVISSPTPTHHFPRRALQPEGDPAVQRAIHVRAPPARLRCGGGRIQGHAFHPPQPVRGHQRGERGREDGGLQEGTVVRQR